MMAVPYLEHFLDSLETLPSDLTRNFTLMRDLDTKTDDLVNKINKTAEDYMIGVNEYIGNDRKDKLMEIHEMFEKAKVLSDDKVQLAMQTYEMVDKHIRRLDTELTKFDTELKEKHINTGSNISLVSDEELKKKTKGRVDKTRVIGFNPKNVIKSDNEKGRKKHDVKVETVVAVNSNITSSLPALMANSNEALDMPVDPNEPTYCLCHQVSYGEMIGCDNPDCPIEWFHFGCVGLTIKPKGKWFCPKCIVERKKK